MHVRWEIGNRPMPVALVGGSWFTVVVVPAPFVRFAYDKPQLHLALETAEGMIAAHLAYLYDAYDAAIVTADFDAQVAAEVVIGLPDTEHHQGEGHRAQLTIGGASDEIDIHDQREVIDLLDTHVPTQTSRRERLAVAVGQPAP